MNSTFVFNLLDNDMLYDEIQSTIEPVPSPSSAPAIFVEAPEIEILPAEPTASNEIIQHNPENLPHNDDILQWR